MTENNDEIILERPCETAKDFFKKVIFDNCDNFCQPNMIIYRGQADSEWPLVPSLFRSNNGTKILNDWDEAHIIGFESYLLKNFIDNMGRINLTDATSRIALDGLDHLWLENFSQNRQLSYLKKICPTKNPAFSNPFEDWPNTKVLETLALAQHFGLPTRLLDWASNPNVAIYFAAEGAVSHMIKKGDKEENKKLAVWVCSSSYAQDINTEASSIASSINGIPTGLYKFSAPYALSNPNAAAQSGCFLFFRSIDFDSENPFNIDDYIKKGVSWYRKNIQKKVDKENPDLNNFLIKYTLPYSKAFDLLTICRKYNFSRTTMYPDYYGCAQDAIIDTNINNCNFKTITL